MGQYKRNQGRMNSVVKSYRKGNNNLEQHKGYQEIINTPIPGRQTQDFKPVIIDPTIPHTPAGKGLLAWGIGSSVVNNAITSGTPGLLEAGKHNNLLTKPNHHPPISVDNVAPNLSVKQQSSAKSGKTLNATTKIAKQVKAINHDEPSSSYSEVNDQQSIIRAKRALSDALYTLLKQGSEKILVVRTKELDINTIIGTIIDNPDIDKLDILPFTINDQKTKDLITELSKHNIHNITFVKDTSLFYHKHYPPLKPVSDNSTSKDILGDNQNSLSTTSHQFTSSNDMTTCEASHNIYFNYPNYTHDVRMAMKKNIADDVYTKRANNLCFNKDFDASFFKEQLTTNPNVTKLILSYNTMNSGTAKLLGEILKDTSINTLIIKHSLELNEIEDLVSMIKGTNIKKLILRGNNINSETAVTVVKAIKDNNLDIKELDLSNNKIEPKAIKWIMAHLKDTTVTIDIDSNTEDNLLETSATPESYTAPEETVSKESILWRIVGGVGALALSGFGVYASYKKFFGNEKVEKSLDSNQTIELELRDSPPPTYDDNDPTYEAINPDNISATSIAIDDVYNAEDASSTVANATAVIDNDFYNIEPTNIPISSSSQEVAAMSNIPDIDAGYDTVGPAEEPQGVIPILGRTYTSIVFEDDGSVY